MSTGEDELENTIKCLLVGPVSSVVHQVFCYDWCLTYRSSRCFLKQKYRGWKNLQWKLCASNRLSWHWMLSARLIPVFELQRFLLLQEKLLSSSFLRNSIFNYLLILHMFFWFSNWLIASLLQPQCQCSPFKHLNIV